MSFIEKLRDLFDAEDELEEFANEVDSSTERAPLQNSYISSPGTKPLPKREPIFYPLGGGHEGVEYTKKYKIVVAEPRSYNDSPKLVDSLKTRKPLIINLKNIDGDTAKKIYYYLLGAVCALDGNVHKIAQNIYLFLPENAEVQAQVIPFSSGTER